jgi:hypothetical protein
MTKIQWKRLAMLILASGLIAAGTVQAEEQRSATVHSLVKGRPASFGALLIEDRTYVNMKGLLDCLPYYVLSSKGLAFFNNETKTLHVYGIPYPDDPSAYFKIRVGDKTAQVGDERIELEQPAVLIHDHIYVPLRPVIEAYGLGLEWDAKTKTATVSLLH